MVQKRKNKICQKIFQSLNRDFIQVVNDVAARDADWIDWFVGVDKVKNRTGDWFFGVAALRNDVRTTAYSTSMIQQLRIFQQLPSNVF